VCLGISRQVLIVVGKGFGRELVASLKGELATGGTIVYPVTEGDYLESSICSVESGGGATGLKDAVEI